MRVKIQPWDVIELEWAFKCVELCRCDVICFGISVADPPLRERFDDDLDFTLGQGTMPKANLSCEVGELW